MHTHTYIHTYVCMYECIACQQTGIAEYVCKYRYVRTYILYTYEHMNLSYCPCLSWKTTAATSTTVLKSTDSKHLSFNFKTPTFLEISIQPLPHPQGVNTAPPSVIATQPPPLLEISTQPLPLLKASTQPLPLLKPQHSPPPPSSSSRPQHSPPSSSSRPQHSHPSPKKMMAS